MDEYQEAIKEILKILKRDAWSARHRVILIKEYIETELDLKKELRNKKPVNARA